MSAVQTSTVQPSVAKAVLGKSVVFKGQIQSREDLIIEGEVEGTIEMAEHRLTIAADGDVHANVSAREIEVIGSIEGRLEAVDKVYIRRGAKFIGDIHAAGIIIEDGGYIKGNIDLSRLSESKIQTAASQGPQTAHTDSVQAYSDVA